MKGMDITAYKEKRKEKEKMNESEKKIDAKLIFSIIAAGIMSFSGVVVETAMNVTFPTLMEEFGIGTSTVQWITTGYLLILAMIIPCIFLFEKALYSEETFCHRHLSVPYRDHMAAVTPVFSLLLLGRLIQGVGTGIALPLMFNIVLEQVPAKKLGLMMGIASLITAMAPAVGPSVGGMLVSNFGWRMIFISLIPLLLLLFFPGSLSIRQVTETEKISFPMAGLHLFGCRLRLLYLCHQYSFRSRLDQRSGTWTSGSQHYLYCDILSEM